MRRLRKDESGVSLIELMVASALAALILGFVLNMLNNGTRTERATEARQTVQLALQDGMTKITKDLRQASQMSLTSTTSKLDFQTYVDASLVRIVYEVTGSGANRILQRTVCVNTDLNQACGGGQLTIVTHVSSTTVPFCFDPPGCSAQSIASTPSAVRVTLAAEPAVLSSGPITFSTDVQLRNVQSGGS